MNSTPDLPGSCLFRYASERHPRLGAIEYELLLFAGLGEGTLSALSNFSIFSIFHDDNSSRTLSAVYTATDPRKNGEPSNLHRHCSWCGDHHIRHSRRRRYRHSCRCDPYLRRRHWAHRVLLPSTSQASEKYTTLSIWNSKCEPFFHTIDRNATV